MLEKKRPLNYLIPGKKWKSFSTSWTVIMMGTCLLRYFDAKNDTFSKEQDSLVFLIKISYFEEFMGEESTIEKLFKNMDKVRKKEFIMPQNKL